MVFLGMYHTQTQVEVVFLDNLEHVLTLKVFFQGGLGVESS